MAGVRRALAVLAGVIAAGATVALVEAIAHAAVDGQALFVVVAAGYALAAVIGSLIARMIADRRATIAVPVILAILAMANLFAFPHPPWFIPASAAALVSGWWIGMALGSRRGRGHSGVGT